MREASAREVVAHKVVARGAPACKVVCKAAAHDATARGATIGSGQVRDVSHNAGEGNAGGCEASRDPGKGDPRAREGGSGDGGVRGSSGGTVGDARAHDAGNPAGLRFGFSFRCISRVQYRVPGGSADFYIISNVLYGTWME